MLQPESLWAATKDATCHSQDLAQLNNKQTRIIISKELNNNKQTKQESCSWLWERHSRREVNCGIRQYFRVGFLLFLQDLWQYGLMREKSL